jgi:hypothetical protein
VGFFFTEESRVCTARTMTFASLFFTREGNEAFSLLTYTLDPASHSNRCSNFASTSLVAPGVVMCKVMR